MGIRYLSSLYLTRLANSALNIKANRNKEYVLISFSVACESGGKPQPRAAKRSWSRAHGKSAKKTGKQMERIRFCRKSAKLLMPLISIRDDTFRFAAGKACFGFCDKRESLPGMSKKVVGSWSETGHASGEIQSVSSTQYDCMCGWTWKEGKEVILRGSIVLKQTGRRKPRSFFILWQCSTFDPPSDATTLLTEMVFVAFWPVNPETTCF